MEFKNYEFKAKVADIEQYEKILLGLNPKFEGTDFQIDTYFNAPLGRLKLREGSIENALIHYIREDIANSKESNIILYKHIPDDTLKEILKRQLGIKIIVSKTRKIYFIENVKFHFDIVQNLGAFIEVEAIDYNNVFELEELKNQCNHYFNLFKLESSAMVHLSYSDLLMANNC